MDTKDILEMVEGAAEVVAKTAPVLIPGEPLVAVIATAVEEIAKEAE